MKNLNMTNGMRVGMSFSKVRGGLCSLTLVSLLCLSMALLAGLAGAQARNLKRVGGSSGLAVNGAERAQNPENLHSNSIHNNVLYSFCYGMSSNLGSCQGFQPVASVILDNGFGTPGALYGTDMGGEGPPCTGAGVTGANPLECDPPYVPRGQVYMYNTTTNVETVIHQFNSFNGDGWNSVASLIQDSGGNLYGTTSGGGLAPSGYDNCIPTGGCGTVFKVSYPFTTNGPDTVLYNFEGGPLGGTMDGANPAGALIQDSFGNLYGTTESGGLYNTGIVFVLCAPGVSSSQNPLPCGNFGTWTEEVIHNFGVSGIDGANPLAGLFVDTKGNMWGTTAGGGNYNGSCLSPAGDSTCGTIFELQAGNSGWTYVSAYRFCPGSSCTDGANPVAGVIEGTVGTTIYMIGTTEWGGTAGAGTVFAFGNSANNVIHSFCVNAGCPDGANPVAGLIMDGNGTVYGTTEAGGNYTCQTFPDSFGGCGSAFSITNPLTFAASFQTFYTFCDRPQCTDGMGPAAALTPNGTDYTHLYGTTQYGAVGTQGGPNTNQAYSAGQGTVFEFYPCSLICLLVNPGSMAWGNIEIGGIGVAQSVKVTNSGTEAVQITSIEISGEFAFTKVKGACVSGTTLKAGATCEIGATFDPTQIGYQTGQITISEKADGATQTVALSGTGVE
jgi:uncharacterized repeat protein (TIGR03803 family)